MTEQEFEQITGHKPINDDLERINCSDAGKLGHKQCGVCKHNYPKFLVCHLCRLYEIINEVSTK